MDREEVGIFTFIVGIIIMLYSGTLFSNGWGCIIGFAVLVAGVVIQLKSRSTPGEGGI